MNELNSNQIRFVESTSGDLERAVPCAKRLTDGHIGKESHSWQRTSMQHLPTQVRVSRETSRGAPLCCIERLSAGFAIPPTQIVTFRRSGTLLSISAAGSAVTITTGAGCTIHAFTPATIHLFSHSCRLGGPLGDGQAPRAGGSRRRGFHQTVEVRSLAPGARKVPATGS